MHYVRFEVLIAVNVKVTLFEELSPCSLVHDYQCLGGARCLHVCPEDEDCRFVQNVVSYQRKCLYGIKSLNCAIFIIN